MCYPVKDVDFGDLSIFYEVSKAAMKYEMKKIILILQVKLSHYIEMDSLRMCFTGIPLGLYLHFLLMTPRMPTCVKWRSYLL